ncbi:unnamed protein product [Lupinus luteus]|uniref:BZIP domain-containing protein n=1 Tax=Lupinus luteus TaxID=3873 RepID=A0AAV1WQI9_LUPLU
MLSALSANDLLLANPYSVGFHGGFSDYPEQTHGKEKPIVEERRRRRVISNRESARRSRMRKQRHLENLRNQVNLFRVDNREIKTRLQFLVNHCNHVRTENDCLRELALAFEHCASAD